MAILRKTIAIISESDKDFREYKKMMLQNMSRGAQENTTFVNVQRAEHMAGMELYGAYIAGVITPKLTELHELALQRITANL